MGVSRIAALCACALLASCSARPGRVHRFGGCVPTVSGRDVLCDGARVAAIECHGRVESSCRALAVRYVDGNVAWLYTARWFDPERSDPLDPNARSDVNWASSVEMSPDAALLWYYIDDEDGATWYEYDVQAGMMRPVDTFRIVQLRDLRYRGDVVRVALVDPIRD